MIIMIIIMIASLESHTSANSLTGISGERNCYTAGVKQNIISCGEGTYCKGWPERAQTGIAKCERCPRNYYCEGGSRVCAHKSLCSNPAIKQQCPENHCSDVESIDAKACYVCCPDGQAFSPNLGKCQACPAGKYNDGTTQSCEDCAAGTYAQSAESSGCSACSAGKYAGTGASECGCEAGKQLDRRAETCVSCQEGYYSEFGATECTSCVAGTYADQIGSTACTLCPKDTYSPSVQATSAGVCQPCALTKKSTPGSTVCSDCPPGTYYVTTYDGSQCAPCPVGRYSEQGGSDLDDCQLCPVGRYGAIPGAKNHTDCVLCTPGRYGNSEGSTECSLCGYGKFGKASGAKSAEGCFSCPAGRYNDQLGAHPNREVCKECDVGTYSTKESAGVSQYCLPCDIGKYTTRVASIECMPCVPGRYQGRAGYITSGGGAANNNGQAISTMSSGEYAGCTLCVRGKYQSQHSSSSCVRCPVGRYTNETGSTICKVCKEGKTTLQDGQRECKIDSPTSAPSAAPTSSPTQQKSSVTIAEQTTRLNMSDLSSGAGLHLTGEVNFRQIGYFPGDKYYLTIRVYDTGFGPPSAGQYAIFFINGEAVMAPPPPPSDRNKTENEEVVSPDDGEGNGEGDGGEGSSPGALRCAPVQSTTDTAAACTRKDFVVCKGGYNLDISRHVQVANGGSFKLKVLTKGVLTSYCPFLSKNDAGESSSAASSSSDVVVKYTVTTFSQPTPFPTSMPSPAPTEWSGVINNNNGFMLASSLDIYQLMQISFAVGTLMAAVGVGLCALRKKDPSVQQLAMPLCALRSGMLGAEIVTTVILIVSLFQFDYSTGGLIITVFRFLQMTVGCYFLLGLYGPEKAQSFLNIRDLIAEDHMVNESKPYTVVSILLVVDAAYIVFLPWKKSQFAELSKGFPNMHILTITAFSAIAQAIVSICVQAPFLAGSSFDMSRDFMSVLNIIILSIKILVFSSEFIMKRTLLLSKTTAEHEQHGEHEDDKTEDGNGRGDKNRENNRKEGETEGWSERQGDNDNDTVAWTENPLRVQMGKARTSLGSANDTAESDQSTLLKKITEAELCATQARQDVITLREWIQGVVGVSPPSLPQQQEKQEKQEKQQEEARGRSSWRMRRASSSKQGPGETKKMSKKEEVETVPTGETLL